MLACREALTEADGDVDRAVEILRTRGQAQAAKRAGAEATEGVVQSYIHAGNKIGVLVEVDCQTDFVARNEKFIEFARDLALHIAASPATLAISDEDVPAEDREREERIATEQAARPARRTSASGSSRASSTSGSTRSCCCARSTSTRTSTAVRRSSSCAIELADETRENVVIRRFVRFAVGG